MIAFTFLFQHHEREDSERDPVTVGMTVTILVPDSADSVPHETVNRSIRESVNHTPQSLN